MPPTEIAQSPSRHLPESFAHRWDDNPNDTSESVATKLYREAELLLVGTGRGIKASAIEAWNHPLDSGLKIGVSAVIGGGLALLQGRAGLLRLGAQVTGLAFGYNFYKDVYRRGSVTTDAMVDAWHSGKNLERDKQVIAKTVGPFVVDSALMTAGGMAGVGIARIPKVYNNFNYALDKITGSPMLAQEALIRQRMLQKDEGTLRHEDRVGETSKLIAQEMKLPPGSVEAAEKAGRFHDTGKILTPDEILLSDKKLTDVTRPIMERHAADTKTILSEEVTYPRRLRDVPEIAGAHHEKLDGTGYPERRSAADIPVETRINTVADVVDAMASERTYKKRSPIANIYDRLVTNSGLSTGAKPTEFDPRVVNAFLNLPANKVFEPILIDGGRLAPGVMKEFSPYTVRQVMEAFTPGKYSSLPLSLEATFAQLYGSTVIVPPKPVVVPKH
jgi:HD-GYP domain-containing protein (c-di-GMP phosphodiesterase class II)